MRRWKNTFDKWHGVSKGKELRQKKGQASVAGSLTFCIWAIEKEAPGVLRPYFCSRSLRTLS